MKKITLLFGLLFISLQINSQVLISQSFDTALGWTSARVSGTSTLAGWSRQTTGTNPNCAPFAGTGMARFNSYDVPLGNSYRLTSPAITFAGANYRVRFKMYRDGTYETDADKIQVYYNTIASTVGGTLLGTVNRSTALSPTVSADGWYSYDFDIPGTVTGTGYISMLASSFYGNNIFIDSISVEQIQSNDAQLSSVDLSSYILNGATTIQGTLKNLGLNTINSIDLNWQVDSGTIYTQSITGLSVAAGQSYSYSHANQWNSTSGTYSLKVWLSNVNSGATDADLTNDLITKTIDVVNEIFPKVVVYEEGTGTWCQWCPRGHVGLKDMLHNHNDGTFIGIAVHNNDPMTLTAYNSGLSTFISGYPSGAINRMPTEVDPGASSLEPSYQKELAKIPLGKLNIPDVNWDSTTRQITFDVTAKFARDMAVANYNLASIIIENGVTGTTSAYNQVNAYSGSTTNILVDWQGVNWNTLPNPVPAAQMVYDHVGRALLGGFAGFAGSIPSSVVYNAPYTYSFSHTLPATQNVNNVEVVGILIDNATGQIVNANVFDLGNKLAVNTFDSKNKFIVYPNPSNGILHIATDKTVSVDVTDVLGKLVFSSKNVTNQTVLDLSSLLKGVYFVRVVADNSVSTEKIILK
jgi:hypothetical protein